MAHRSPDDEACRFLTTPGADLDVRLDTDSLNGSPELQIFGNRAGILSLANVLLWLNTNTQREFLSLGELPFLHMQGSLSLCVRVDGGKTTGRDGLICRTDQGEQFEWVLSDDDLQRVALTMHSLASRPGHEYDRLSVADGSAVGIHVRMTDALVWIRTADHSTSRSERHDIANEKMISVLEALLQATQRGELKWENTASEDVFRAWVGDQIVKIRELHRPGENDLDPGDLYFTAWVINALNEVVDKIELWPSQPGYTLLESLFALARRNARKADQVLDNILSVLKSKQ